MSRRILCAGLLIFLVVAPASSWLEGAEKSTKDSPPVIQAREQVEAALRAEAAGDNERRGELLHSAWLAAPDLPEANWHLARVQVQQEWLSAGQLASQVASDSNLAKYRELRSKLDTVRSVRELARWCQKHKMTDRARLHYAQLLTNRSADADLKQEAAKELELQQVGNVWLTREEAAARSTEAKQIEASIGKWRPRLKKLQTVIDGNDFKLRDQAIGDFHRLDDASLIPAVQLMLADSGDRFQEEAVKYLTRFPQFEATLGLTRFAVLARFGFVREAAIQALKSRPLHEYVPNLLEGLTSPVKSQFQVNWDAAGRIGYAHAFLREGATGNMLLVSQGLALPNDSSSHVTQDDRVRVAAPEIPKENRATAAVGISQYEAFARQREAALTRAAITESQVQIFNSAVEGSNQRLFEALEQTTNQQLPREPIQWWNWWQGYNEYQWPRPTMYLYQSNAHAYDYGISTYTHLTGTTRRTSCFLAGTPVRTETGEVPIESIQPGDRVLAQDQDTGELTYKVVLSTTLRPPTNLLRITAGDEKITTTFGHPFWVDGHGWKMAKELATGDLLHSLGGAVRVERIEPAGESKAHNLVADDFNTYFVGHQGILVHDNEFRKPTRAIVPGLIGESLAARK